MREILRDSRFKWLAGLFVFFTVWFVVENVSDIDNGRIFSWTNFYFILPLYGAIFAIIVSRSWGGIKSTIGKAITLFAAGLLLQVFGQLSYSYYYSFFGIDLPYPSIGDVGYFGSILIYIYGLVLLARAVGVSFLSKSISKQVQIIIIPIILVVLPWVLFLRSYTFVLSDSLRTGLDVAYLIGEALYVSMAVTILIFSYRYHKIGKAIRWPVLWVLLALIVQYIADFNFLYQSQPGIETWVMGQYGDYLYLIAYLAMSFALLQFRTTITFPIANFSQLAQRIIEEQERVIGPLAWSEAQRVRGLVINPDTRAITFTQTPSAVIEKLLQHFETTFGRASREACRSIVRQFTASLPPDQQPASFNQPEQRLEYINEELYRQNLELAEKNRMLALRRQLYENSLLASDGRSLAQMSIQTLCIGYDALLVAVFMFDNQQVEKCNLLAITGHPSLEQYFTNIGSTAENVQSEIPTLHQIIKMQLPYVLPCLTPVWNAVFSMADVEKIEEQCPTATTIIYPLIRKVVFPGIPFNEAERLHKEAFGFLVITLPSDIQKLTAYERESLDDCVRSVQLSLDWILLYQQLKQANYDLQRLNEQQSQFLTDIAHELQSPLAIVSGNVDVLARKYTDETDTISASQSSLKRLSRLINNLLLLARADFGIFKLQRNEQDICEMLQRLYTETETLADTKDITYHYQCAPGQYRLNIDGEQIKGACLNILSNAFKYTPAGGTVTMNVSSTPENVCIQFYNSGGHIPTEDMAHLFERFYRREVHEKNGKKGTGLGLAIAKTVVEEHGGTITVHNVEPDGVEFIMTIPRV